ncbi:MAG: tandem-95 repeat protein, partial [Actinomycetia bacterium]|nr:tandem-95 repeat protein [Actinomycetes bacterium]
NGGISTAEAALEIVPVGALPALADDLVGALEDTPTTIDVLANDTSTDATVDPATLRIDQPPTDGATSVVDGVVRYTPDADWSGSDSFDYLACDTNDYCGTATVTVTVAAVNDAPSFGAGADQTVPEDYAPVTVAGWASGLAVGPTDESTQTAVFVVTTVDPSLFSSQPAIDPAGTLTYSLAADANGTTTASVTLVDDGGAANGGSDTSPAHALFFTIPPSNDAPSFGAGADQTVAEDSGPKVVPGWATGISPGPADESGQATVFGSVTADPGLFTATPAVAPDGTLSFTPAPDANGTTTVTVWVQDDGGTENAGIDTSPNHTLTVTITASNDAPAANDDAGAGYSTSEDTALITPDVTTNDTDVDDPIDPGSVVLVTNGTNGVAVNNGDGTFTYTPDPDWSGTDTFTYTITDPGPLTSNQATVTVAVSPVNDAPVANDDSGVGFTTPEDVAITTRDVTTNDTDIDSPTNPASVALTTNGTNGTAVNNGDGTFTYTPDLNYTGTDTFTYTITDSGGQTSTPATVTMSITAGNDAPVAVDDSGAGYSTNEDTPFTTPNVTTNDTDIDSPIDPTTATMATGPANGVALNNGDGTFTYTPDPDWSGTDTFTYTIYDDGLLLSNEAAVTVVVGPVNDAPVVTNPGAQAADAGLGFNLQIMATDIEFDDLSYGAAGLPTGLSISGTGLISGTTDPGAVGIHSVDVTVTDDGTPNEATIMNFVIDVAPHTASTHAGSIVINEVLHKQASNPFEEFVELYNAGGSAVDLTGWTLAD